MSTLCVDFGGTEIKLGILERSRFLVSASLPNQGSDGDLQRVRETVDQLRRSVESGAVSAVGIAVPGVVDRAHASLVAAHGKYPYLRDRDLRAWANDAFDVDAVVVENDARAALVGEA